MSLKDIAVFVDPTPEGDDRLRLAATIAQRHNARLSGLYVIRDPHPGSSFVRGRQAIQSMIENYVTSEQRNAVQNGKRFAAAAIQHGVQSNFHMIWSGRNADRRIILNSLVADMLVIGDKPPHGLPDYWQPKHLLFASGVPLLVVPIGHRIKTIAERIIIAWNATKEARRATADALPVLATAQSVTVLVVDQISEQRGIDLALHLARHGVQAKIEHVMSDGAPIADVILSRASKHDADLIVIGAYSHAKPVRTIFGGVTQSILNRMTIPVLMSR